MSEAVTATRAQIPIGDMTVDGFMLPDGSYRMSLSQVSELVGLRARNAFDFLQTKALKRLLGEDYTVSVFKVEISSEGQTRGQSRFDALPLEVVSAYWLWQSHRGNKQALGLCMALIIESLERRFDNAFGVERSEDERNQRTSERIQSLEKDLARLGEAYAVEDDIRRERDLFEQLLRENNIDPYDLSRGEKD